MATRADHLVSEIRSLPEEENLQVLDALLADLNERDQEIDQIWAKEARERWRAYKAGKIETVSYDELIEKYRR
jgi:putative addiction module component